MVKSPLTLTHWCFSVKLTPVIIYEGASRSSKTESVMKYALTFVTGYCYPFLGFIMGLVCLPLLKAPLDLTWDCM